MKEEARRFGANAVIAIDLDYKTIGSGGGNMLMVSASGTAVTFEEQTMIFLIVLFITLSITSISLILTRRKLSRFNFPRWILFLVIIILIVGSSLMYISATEISEALTRQSWPIHMATVTGTEIVGERAYSPQLKCDYTVEGKIYTLTTDLKTPGFGRTKTRRQTAEIILNEYPPGSEVRIRYNPDNPEEAFIRIGPYWSDYLKVSLGVLLSVLGLYGWIGIIIRKFS